MMKSGLFSAVFFCIFATGFGLVCYECNVWKAGWGHFCDANRTEWRKLEPCVVCMKLNTTAYMGYYKYNVRSSNIESRICDKQKSHKGRTGCHDEASPDGYRRICYCDTDLCNNAPGRVTSLSVLATVVIATVTAKFNWT